MLLARMVEVLGAVVSQGSAKLEATAVYRGEVGTTPSAGGAALYLVSLKYVVLW